MSADAKTEILERLHGALSDHPQAPEVPRDYRHTSELSRDEIVDMLEDRLLDYKANVYRETAQTVAQRIATQLGASARYVIPEGLDTALLPEETAARRAIVDPNDGRKASALTVRDLNRVDAVVTSSTVSCAQTGTIFLSGRPDEGRRAITLVPDHHMPLDSVVELIPEAMARVEPTAPTTMISGPSATSDIELERVEGVHGPRTLDVILLG